MAYLLLATLWAALGAVHAERLPVKHYTTADGLAHDRVKRIVRDSRGFLWFCTADGLSRFDGYRFVTFTTAHGLPHTMVNDLLETRSGVYWIATDGGGVCRFNPSSGAKPKTAAGPERSFREGAEEAGQRFVAYPVGELAATNSVNVLYEDRNGHLWAGTDAGLFRMDETGGRRVFARINLGLTSLPDEHFHVWALVEDQEGTLWLGSSSGLMRRLPDGHVTHYPIRPSQGVDHVWGLLADRERRIWVGHDAALIVIQPEAAPVVTDGLASNEVFVSYHDRNGTLWFRTRQGLSRLNPEPDRPRSPPPILIDGIRIAGVSFPVSSRGESTVSQLELAPQQNHVQIDFLGLSFAAGELLRYQIMLEGEDSDWGPLTDQRTVYYAGLSPGKYRFLVRAVTADGATSPSPAQVTLRILPPFWQQWWFVSLAAMFAAAMLYGAHHYRVARLVEIERIRTRIATDLHDDIGASLSQIAILSEVARHQLGGDRAPVEESLSVIAGGSRELVDSMSDIVWSIDPFRDRLSDLTQRMRRFASDTFSARNIAFRFDAPVEEHNMDLGVDVRRQVYLIFKESVNNVVRHSGCTEAEVELAIEGDCLSLKVADNGKGFEQEQTSDGHGLPSMQERAKNLGGTLEVTSQLGMGTAIILRVPIASRRPGHWRRFLPK